MNKVLILQPDIPYSDLIICYGHKSYHNIIAKRYQGHEFITSSGITAMYEHTEKYGHTVIVGIKKLKHFKDVDKFKTTLIHELSHMVTYVMNHFGFTCDEFRSYLLEWIYGKTMPFIDDILNKELK